MKGLLSSWFVLGILEVILLAACVSQQKHLLDSEASQLELRSIQTRVFDTTDREKMLRTVMATLQDFGFMLEAGEVRLGTVTAAKWVDAKLMRMTVAVRPHSGNQMLVRANCHIEKEPVEDPLTYQQFFAALSKALFLEAQQVE